MLPWLIFPIHNEVLKADELGGSSEAGRWAEIVQRHSHRVVEECAATLGKPL